MAKFVLMGSGETAPSLSKVHRSLLSTLPEARACWFNTPYGFQENVSQLSEKTVEFFQKSCGQVLRVADYPSQDVSTSKAQLAFSLARDSNYLFSGPGSPSYALRQWQGTELVDIFREKLESPDSVLVFSSATACTVGAYALPVYEIYKVGQEPHWLEGLDLLSHFGFRVAVLPHYNNTVGGNHDTRFCYMGERRLALLEKQLPEDVWVWGVDEHTAVTFDLAGNSFEVLGKGLFTVRHQGLSKSYPSGHRGSLQTLRGSTEGFSGVPTAQEINPEPQGAQGLISESLKTLEAEFVQALESGQEELLTQALLQAEETLETWRGDSDQHHRDKARATYRHMLLHLVQSRGADEKQIHALLAPLVEGLLSWRKQSREGGDYALGDKIRDLLLGAGLEVMDSPEGSTWKRRSTERVPQLTTH